MLIVLAIAIMFTDVCVIVVFIVVLKLARAIKHLILGAITNIMGGHEKSKNRRMIPALIKTAPGLELSEFLFTSYHVATTRAKLFFDRPEHLWLFPACRKGATNRKMGKSKTHCAKCM